LFGDASDLFVEARGFAPRRASFVRASKVSRPLKEILLVGKTCLLRSKEFLPLLEERLFLQSTSLHWLRTVLGKRKKDVLRLEKIHPHPST
jgi:hypothetical protein